MNISRAINFSHGIGLLVVLCGTACATSGRIMNSSCQTLQTPHPPLIKTKMRLKPFRKYHQRPTHYGVHENVSSLHLKMIPLQLELYRRKNGRQSILSVANKHRENPRNQRTVDKNTPSCLDIVHIASANDHLGRYTRSSRAVYTAFRVPQKNPNILCPPLAHRLRNTRQRWRPWSGSMFM